VKWSRAALSAQGLCAPGVLVGNEFEYISNLMTEPGNDKILFFKKWGQWYAFLVIVLIVLITLFYFFTKHFS